MLNELDFVLKFCVVFYMVGQIHIINMPPQVLRWTNHSSNRAHPPFLHARILVQLNRRHLSLLFVALKFNRTRLCNGKDEISTAALRDPVTRRMWRILYSNRHIACEIWRNCKHLYVVDNRRFCLWWLCESCGFLRDIRWNVAKQHKYYV